MRTFKKMKSASKSIDKHLPHLYTTSLNPPATFSGASSSCCRRLAASSLHWSSSYSQASEIIFGLDSLCFKENKMDLNNAYVLNFITS